MLANSDSQACTLSSALYPTDFTCSSIGCAVGSWKWKLQSAHAHYLNVRAHMDAKSTYQVFDWLWTSGQLSERDIHELPSLGIAAVINLALPTSSNALPGEAELISGEGISYFQIPVIWESPKLAQLELFFNILDSMKGQKVWVHCALNMRVSAFIYLYRKLRIKDVEEKALYPMSQVWEPNETWKLFIQQAVNAL